MVSILENQHVAKRNRTHSNRAHSYRHTNKSAGFNAGFMNQFSRKPSHSKSYSRLHSKKRSGSFFSFFKLFLKEKKPSSQRSYQASSASRKKEDHSERMYSESKTSSGFSFPVPSFATLAVVAGTVLISLVALRYDNFSINLPENHTFQAESMENSADHAMRYAATGVAGGGLLNLGGMSDFESIMNFSEISETDAEGTVAEDLIFNFKWHEHRVQRGETISGIASRFGVSMGAIIASNEIRNARRVQEGTVLRIPNIDGIPYSVKAGDSLAKISASFNVPLDVILDVNDIRSEDLKTGETIFIPGARMNDMDLRMSLGDLFIYPVPGRVITSGYGMRRDPFTGVMSFHNGIDLRAPTGTPVVASMDGVVSVVSQNWLYGRFIIISHTNGYKTLYAHLNSFSVRQGERVTQGRKIGEAGNTGRSTGSHLHFSMYNRSGNLMNPLDLLR